MSTFSPQNIAPDTPPTGQGPVQTQRSLDPRTSVEDYNRVMLAYTQRRMSVLDDGRGSPASRSSHRSDSTTTTATSASGNSGVSSRQSGTVSSKDFAQASPLGQGSNASSSASSSKLRF